MLVGLAVTPFGSRTYQTDFQSENYFIGRLAPSERLAGSVGEAGRTIIAEPVYFSLFTPRPFRQAEVTVEYEGTAPLIELGLRRGDAWNFARQPLWHAGLEKLAHSAKTVAADGVMLWQREKKYASIATFSEAPPLISEVATYNFPFKNSFLLKEYVPETSERMLEVGLRGNYIIQTYSGGEPIRVRFFIHDINLNKDTDAVRATLYDEAGRNIASASLGDDGAGKGVTTSTRELQIATEALPAGPYRLEFSANDDIITDRIRTMQSKLSFVNQLPLSGAGRQNISLVTDAARLTAQTSAPASRQEIVFDGNRLDLSQTYTQFHVSGKGAGRSSRQISLKKDDVTLSGDGSFAFTASELIDVTARQFTASESAVEEQAAYVIARYTPHSPGAGRAVFQLGEAYRENGKYSFMIAAPGVSAAAPLTIRTITVRLSGQTLWQWVREKLPI